MSGACHVTFEISVHTTVGETVVIVGDTSALGGWDVTKGLWLETDESRYPKWTASIVLPSGRDIEYKYVVIDSDRDSPPPSPSAIRAEHKFHVRWEDPPFVNRHLEPHAGEMLVEDGNFGGAQGSVDRLLRYAVDSIPVEGTDGGVIKVVNLSDDPKTDYMPRDCAITDVSGFIALAVAVTVSEGGRHCLSADQMIGLLDAVKPNAPIWAKVTEIMTFVMDTRAELIKSNPSVYAKEGNREAWRALPLQPWEAGHFLRSNSTKLSTIAMLRSVQVGETSALGVRCDEDDFVHLLERRFVEQERPFRGIAEEFVQCAGGRCLTIEDWASATAGTLSTGGAGGADFTPMSPRVFRGCTALMEGGFGTPYSVFLPCSIDDGEKEGLKNVVFMLSTNYCRRNRFNHGDGRLFHNLVKVATACADTVPALSISIGGR